MCVCVYIYIYIYIYIWQNTFIQHVKDCDKSFLKSNNFGHTETKTAIPIGTKARIDTSKDIKIELLENCVK